MREKVILIVLCVCVCVFSFFLGFVVVVHVRQKKSESKDRGLCMSTQVFRQPRQFFFLPIPFFLSKSFDIFVAFHQSKDPCQGFFCQFLVVSILLKTLDASAQPEPKLINIFPDILGEFERTRWIKYQNRR